MEHILGPNDPRVRTRAYDLWEREGRPEGRHLDHWAQAAREIADEDAANGGGSNGGGDFIPGPDDGLQVPDNASSRTLREAAEQIGSGTVRREEQGAETVR